MRKKFRMAKTVQLSLKENARNSNIDNDADEEYNEEDVYTAAEIFYREVAREDRHIFARSLAYQTTDMKSGEIRPVMIMGAKRVYFFEADGYMQGFIIESYSSNQKNRIKEGWENVKSEQRFDGEIEGQENKGKDSGIWVDAVPVERGRSISYLSASAERRGADTDDRFSGEPSQRDKARSDAYSVPNRQISEEEFQKALNWLRNFIYGETVESSAIDKKERDIRFSLMDSPNQQTSDDFTPLLTSAGIEGEAAEIHGDLADLYEWIEQYQTEPYEKAKDAKQADGRSIGYINRVQKREIKHWLFITIGGI